MYEARLDFGAMEDAVFDRAAADAVVEQIGRLRTPRVLLIVSGALSRATSGIKNEIRKITPGIPRKINGPAQIREILLLAA